LAAVVKADGRGKLIPSSDWGGAPEIYRDGDYFHGLADNMNWHLAQWKASPIDMAPGCRSEGDKIVDRQF
jgi:hypothetical protein